ncbi:MAG: hypothetical protein WCK21_07320 [Actinomycetota bacterium]
MRHFDLIQTDNFDHKHRRERATVLQFQQRCPSADEPNTVMELRATYHYQHKSSTLGALHSVELSADLLTPTEIARFPWSRWLKLAELHALAGTSLVDADFSMFDLAGREPPDSPPGRKAKAATDSAVRRQTGELARPGRKGHESGFYEAVAQRWGELRTQGDPHPAGTISEERGYSVNTVNGWLRECRKRALMPKSTRGRYAGGGAS